MVKKDNAKFTIQFSRTNAKHMEVAQILNRLERFGKAQYIVDAVLFFENRVNNPISQQPSQASENGIEDTIGRLLRELKQKTEGNSADIAADLQMRLQPQTAEEICYDESLDSLGEGGLDAITGALEMFRNK